MGLLPSFLSAHLVGQICILLRATRTKINFELIPHLLHGFNGHAASFARFVRVLSNMYHITEKVVNSMRDLFC